MLYFSKFLTNLKDEFYMLIIAQKTHPQSYGIHKEHLVENRALVLRFHDWIYTRVPVNNSSQLWKPSTPCTWPSYQEVSSIRVNWVSDPFLDSLRNSSPFWWYHFKRLAQHPAFCRQANVCSLIAIPISEQNQRFRSIRILLIILGALLENRKERIGKTKSMFLVSAWFNTRKK